MTNSDKIRQMSDEELTEFFVWYVGCTNCPAKVCCSIGSDINECRKSVGYWLKQEAKENE